MDVSKYFKQNSLVSFERIFLTPDDDGGGLDTTNWGGTTYKHTYSPLEEDCVHFRPNLKSVPFAQEFHQKCFMLNRIESKTVKTFPMQINAKLPLNNQENITNFRYLPNLCKDSRSNADFKTKNLTKIFFICFWILFKFLRAVSGQRYPCPA